MDSEKAEIAESASEKGTAQESAKSNSSTSKLLSLHDCLSLGEIQAGLERRQAIRDDNNGNEGEDEARKKEESLRSEEVQRLPYLLRLLSSTRPLATIHPFKVSKSEKEEKDESSTCDGDEYLDRIVDRLEDVAANYSVAEGIDVLTNHLGPSVAKNLSKLPPLVRSGEGWKTEDLAAVARDPVAKRKRKRKDIGSSKKAKNEADEAANEDALGASSDEDDTRPMDIAVDEMIDDRRASFNFNRRDSMLVAAEDSQESTVIKTLSEVASLVVASLEQNHEAEGDDDPGVSKISSLTLETDDILSEKAASALHTTEGNDLSSTIVSIMYNAPVLQSRHVARAFCRASIPQAGALISRLGANCPASVPSLLLGCIDAYLMSVEHHRKGDKDGISSRNSPQRNWNCPVATASKQAIRALANLSDKESCRVRTKLQSLGIMVDMQLELLLEGTNMKAKREMNIIPISCLLIEHLSFQSSMNREEESADPTTNVSTGIPLETKTNLEGEQTPGDTNTDSTQEKVIFEYADACSQDGEPSMLLQFLLNEKLYAKTLLFFEMTMKEHGPSKASLEGIQKSVGRWCMFLRAFALLLLVPRPRSTTGLGDTCLRYEASTESFLEMIRKMNCTSENTQSGEKRPKQSKMDTLVALVSSCAILVSSRTFASKEDRTAHFEKISLNIIKRVFEILHSTSDQSNQLQFSLEKEIRMGNTIEVFKRALYPLERVSSIQKGYSNNSYLSIQAGLQKICEVTFPLVVDTKEETEMDISFDIPFRLSTLRREMDSCSTAFVEEMTRSLSAILNEEIEYKSLPLMSKVESAQFVVEATNCLVKPGSSEIPLVLPANIDMAWSRITSNWKATDFNPTDGRGYIFLLRIMYAFIFLDKCPLSPFTIDPRSLPMKESLVMIQNIPSRSTRNYLLTEIQGLLRRHYPELTRFRIEEHVGFRETTRFDSIDRKTILAALCSSIQVRMRGDNPQLDENTTEQLFLQAKAQICDSELYAAVTNAFLSTANAPSPTYSYYRMCRDPIVCLKFPLCVWECRSLRRIALSVLGNLLTSNYAITLKETKISETAMELLAARDAIVVRCLLSVLHKGDSKNMTICSMTTSFIRCVIRSHPGLVALMVKQGLHERDLNWIIENVPETMNDSQCLLKIFSERNGLTAAERLVAADAAIRVAIVHGRINEAEAGQLILTALSQLVDSFYLILGPVGLLPIDALFTAESGAPITQVSQKAAFRILKALTKLKGIKNHVRRDINIMLQKLTSLCKQELQGSATGRRKQIVKDIYDAAIKLEK